MGSSFAFLGGYAAVAEMGESYDVACGGIVVAGALYLVLAAAIYAMGANKVVRYLPPVVTGPIIICIGISLAPSALNNCRACWTLALTTIFATAIISIWGRGTAKIAAVLVGISVAYAVAAVMAFLGFKNTDGSAILSFGETAQQAWIGLPTFITAKFDLSAILVMAPISIATMMEHIGDISAISATTKQNFAEDPGLHRTLAADGIATALAGLFGGPSNTTYGENTGVLVLSGVHNPVVIRVAAIYAIILGFSPRLAGIFGSLPTAVIGGASVVLYGMISAVGIRNLVESRADFSKTRNLIVVSAIMVIGLGSSGVSFATFGTNITLTPLALAAIVGILANAVLPNKDDFSLASPGSGSGSLSMTTPGQEN